MEVFIARAVKQVAPATAITRSERFDRFKGRRQSSGDCTLIPIFGVLRLREYKPNDVHLGENVIDMPEHPLFLSQMTIQPCLNPAHCRACVGIKALPEVNYAEFSNLN